MNTLTQDLQFALRQLRRAPAFALTAILTLALGIGANTAIFSLLDQALLRALPVRAPNELVVLKGTGDAWEGSTHNHGGGVEAYFSYPMYRELRDRNQAFSGLIATAPADVGMTIRGESQPGRAELVSGNYFDVLGVQPALGRLLSPNDDLQPDANPVLVLSFDLWKNVLNADPAIVGQAISLNGRPFQIVGVAPPAFHSSVWGETPNIFVPSSMLGAVLPGAGKRLSDPQDRSINLIARLKPGLSPAQAEAAVAPLWRALRAEELKAIGTRSTHFTDEFLTKSRLRISPAPGGFSYQRSDYKQPLLAVMAMAALVLLIACVNVASLLLVRSAGRAREFSLRFALGARQHRILQQLLLEGLLIGLAGGATGMLLAPLAIRTLIAQIAGDKTHVAFTATIEPRVLVFNFIVAVAASILFSLAPLLQIRRPNLSSTLAQKTATSSGSMLTLRRTVVALQIGLSVLLLVAAGLFVRTMSNLRHVELGFNPSHLITFGINPKLAGYAPAAVPALHQRTLDTLATLPGVQTIAATTIPEIANSDNTGNVTVAGYTAPPDSDFDVELPFINPTYFSSLQIPLLAGRTFTDTDQTGQPKVAIVNEAFAKHFCGTVAACLGRQIASGGGRSIKLDTEIVGIARDTRHTGIREPVIATMFRPLRQQPTPDRLFFYLRTAESPDRAALAVRRAMHQLDPAISLVALRSMDTQIDDNLADDRLIAFLAVAFGILATILAGIGLYGVLAFSTVQRTQEIGIRMALGSSRLAISSLILTDVFRLAALGVAFAIPAALAAGRLLRAQLYNVSAADPIILAAAIAVIASVAFLAALLPARRAASIEPTQALRAE